MSAPEPSRPGSRPPERVDGPSIAVVGAGPSGCYTAQALRRAVPAARVAVFDALPVPYGLIRYGVAADHQGTKAIAQQFARLFEEGGAAFVGNTCVGRDITLDALREAFDVVVLATGMHQDRPLDVTGGDLPGVHGAGRVTRLLNAHPSESDPAPCLGEAVVVVGHGNVALDIARLLTAHTDAFEGSDVDDGARARLAGRVRTVHLVGRSLPSGAKFDVAIARELAGLRGAHHVVHGLDTAGPETDDPRTALIAQLAMSGAPRDARVRIEWWFGYAPARVLGEGRVTGIEIIPATDRLGDAVRIDADSVITAIGFGATPRQQLVELDEAARSTGRSTPGLYVAGWARRGPRGTIPQQRSDARSLAALIADDLADGAARPGRPGLPAIADSLPGATDYAGWLAVDAVETARAAPGRVRAKVRDADELVRIALGR